MRALNVFDGVLADTRHSLRRLRRSPGFAVAAILILAIGIGANTAVFTVVNSVLLRPLTYSEPDRLYAVSEIVPQFVDRFPELPVNARHYLEWKQRCACFEDVALADDGEWNLAAPGEPVRLMGARVTGNFFAVLGVSAQLGRTFVAAEGAGGDENVVMLSDALWQSRFGGNPAIVGQTVELNGVANVVVGVLPRNFRNHWTRPGVGTAPKPIDVYQFWRVDAQGIDWAGEHNYAAVARLPPGKTQEQALAELNVLQAEISQRFEGDERSMTLLGSLISLQEQVVARSRAGLLLLLGAIGTVLIIACLNLGNLLLVRALGDGRETAIRVALGAEGARIFRAALIESLLLACSGGLLGVLLAFQLVRVFAAVAPVDLPRADEVSLDGAALGFALLLSIGAALLFGTLPALRSMRANPQDSLRATGRSQTDRGGGARLREGLVATEVGLSVTLLVVAGLLIASFIRLDGVERGYDAENLLTAEVSLPAARYPDVETRRRFYDELVDRLEGQSDISVAGVGSLLPLGGDFIWGDTVTIEGDVRPIGQRPVMSYRTVSPDFLRALGIPLHAGRQMQPSDYPRRVAILSRSAAERLWPGEDPVGKQFRRGVPTEPAFEVVGVASDVRTAGLDKDPAPLVYVPLWERSPETGALAVRTSSEPLLAAAALRESVRALDPTIPVSQIQTMAQIESDSTAQRRFQTLLVIVFATCALLLAVIGIYGVVAYSVARRTSEIGLRMALGARPRDISTMVLRQGLRPLALGVAAGVAAALVLGRFLSAFLFGVEANDPVTFAAVTGIVGAAALLACWIPARRAMRTAPLEALHFE